MNFDLFSSFDLSCEKDVIYSDLEKKGTIFKIHINQTFKVVLAFVAAYNAIYISQAWKDIVMSMTRKLRLWQSRNALMPVIGIFKILFHLMQVNIAKISLNSRFYDNST